MKLLIVQEDGTYRVTVKNVMRFTLALEYVSIGMSFRQTAAAIEHAKIRIKTAKLSGINDPMVGQLIRVLVAISLQKLTRIHTLDDVWAFSLAFDGSTRRGSSFFDVRTRFCWRGFLYNLHLIALPIFERHTSNNITNLLIQLWDSLFPSWRDRVIGLSSDDENTMTGCILGIVKQIVSQATNRVVRVWYIPHQIDIEVRGGSQEVDGGRWVKWIYTLSVYLRVQLNLIIEMGFKCPKKTSRWVHLGLVIDFLIKYEIRIVCYVAEKNAAPCCRMPRRY
jgi:hypothetical protein